MKEFETDQDWPIAMEVNKDKDMERKWREKEEGLTMEVRGQ